MQDIHPEVTGPYTTVGGMVGVDGFSLFVTIVICVAVVLAALLTDALPAPRGHGGPRVLRAHAAVGRRRRDHGDGQRPHRDLHRPRDAVDRRLRAGGHAPAPHPVAGGGPQVLRARRLLVGVLPLRHRPRSTAPPARPTWSTIKTFLRQIVPTQNGLLLARARPAAGRPRLQGRRRAVPRLDPRRLRGRTHARRRLHGLGRQGRRLRRHGPRLRADLRRTTRRLAADHLRPRRRLDGGRCRRSPSCRPNVKRMLAYSSISHAGFILHGRRGGAPPRAPRRCSSTWPPTRSWWPARSASSPSSGARATATTRSATTRAWPAPTPSWRWRSPCCCSPRPACPSPPASSPSST